MQNNTLVKVALTAVVAVAGVGFLMKSTWGSSTDYEMVDKLVGPNLPRWANHDVRAHGFVLAGSIHEQVVGQETIRTFILQKNGKRIRVFNKGPKPDTFKDESEVIATGTVVAAATKHADADALHVAMESDVDYVIDATELSAKCPSKYDGANANKDLNTRFKTP